MMTTATSGHYQVIQRYDPQPPPATSHDKECFVLPSKVLCQACYSSDDMIGDEQQHQPLIQILRGHQRHRNLIKLLNIATPRQCTEPLTMPPPNCLQSIPHRAQSRHCVPPPRSPQVPPLRIRTATSSESAYALPIYIGYC